MATLNEKIRRLLGPCHFILEKGKSSKRFRALINEMSSLSNALGCLSEVEINCTTHQEACWQNFWTRFGATLDDCEETLEKLDNLLQGVDQLDNMDNGSATEIRDVLRPRIVPLSKAVTIAFELN